MAACHPALSAYLWSSDDEEQTLVHGGPFQAACVPQSPTRPERSTDPGVTRELSPMAGPRETVGGQSCGIRRTARRPLPPRWHETLLPALLTVTSLVGDLSATVAPRESVSARHFTRCRCGRVCGRRLHSAAETERLQTPARCASRPGCEKPQRQYPDQTQPT